MIDGVELRPREIMNAVSALADQREQLFDPGLPPSSNSSAERGRKLQA